MMQHCRKWRSICQQSNIEMLQINGVGAIKLERFGQPFMALIREHKAILERAEKRSKVRSKNRRFFDRTFF